MSPEAAQHALVGVPYLRTLRHAVQLAGGRTALAAAWGVSTSKLGSWLAGQVLLPIDLYVAALAIVQAKGGKWKQAGSC